MVMSSSDIASLNGSYAQQHMMQMQSAHMISAMGGGYNPQVQSQGIAGRAINTGVGVAAPMMGLGMSLAGMDPASMGMSAAWGARGAGAIGMGAAGLGAAGAVGIPLMAAQYAGHQMMHGINQQQQLQGQLGGQFRFANQYGGRGFSSGEMGDIGSMMRQQAGQRGPGGEFATMDELGRLASNMGRLGMDHTVRNAKDFTDKFQKMMKTVKTIAEQMSTSLEQAQEVMASARGAGVFSHGGAVKLSGAIRNGAVSGVASSEEFSQMANIGSQISRAVGGRGQAGAFGGVNALTNVSSGIKGGFINEEDIYNATGMTGAAGRQAFAASQLQGDAQFFKTGKGRHVLASIAKKGGHIDEEAVQEYLAGGVGTGRTLEMQASHLGKVGRADFIRNEGKLRGEAMRAFGGLGRVAAARGWLEDRGMNMDDDRSRIFMSRQFGMDDDQSEVLMKMLRTQGGVANQNRRGQEEDKFIRSLEQGQKFKGIEGVKRKLEEAREHINHKLEDAGANFYREGSNLVEGFINKLTGSFVGTVDRDLGGSIQEVMRGGGNASRMLSERFGIGGKGLAGLRTKMQLSSKEGMIAQHAIFGSSSPGGRDSDVFTEQNKELMERSGYGGASIGNARAIADAYHMDLKPLVMAGAAYKGTMARQSIHGTGARGAEALHEFGEQLERMGVTDPHLKALAREYAAADPTEKAKIMGSMQRGAGQDSNVLEAPELRTLMTGGQFATVSDRHSAIGGYALGKGKKGGVTAGSIFDAMMGPLLGAGLRAFGVDGKRMLDGGKGSITEEAYGRALDSEEGRRTMEGLLSNTSETREAAMRGLADQQKTLQEIAGGDLSRLTDAQRGQYEANRSMAMASDYAQLLESSGGKPTGEQIKALARQHGMGDDVDGFTKMASTPLGVMNQKQREAFAQYTSRAGTESRATEREMRRGGTVDEYGGLTSDTVNKLYDVGAARDGNGKKTGGMSTGESILKSYAAAQSKRAQFGGDHDINADLELGAQKDLAAVEQGTDSLSSADRVKLAEKLRGMAGAGGLRSKLIEENDYEKRFQKSGKGGAAGVLAGSLGLGSDKDFEGMDSAGKRAALHEMLGGKMDEKSMDDLFSGDARKAAKASANFRGSAGFQELQKEKQDKKADASDPNYRALSSIAKSTEAMAGSLKGLTPSNIGSAIQKALKT